MTARSARSGASGESWGRLIRTLLLMLLVVGGATFLAIFLAIPTGWMASPQGRVAVFLSGAIVGESAAFLLLARLLRRRGTTLKDLGLGEPSTRRALALGVGVAVVYVALSALNPSVGENLLRFSSLKLLAIVAAVVAGLAEETIFRGYVMTTIARMGYGSPVQVLVSGAAFAFVHLYAFAGLASILTTWLFTFALGVALAVTYLAGGRSLTPVILSHAFVDLVIEPWLLLGFFTPPGG